jgi:hypothetical protein
MMGRMDNEGVAAEFLRGRGSRRSTESASTKSGSGLEHYQTEPQSLIWAVARVIPLPGF